jgi:hypothetical protein
LTADGTREFTFTTQLDDASLPLLHTALLGAMAAYGIEEEQAAEAAEIVSSYLSGLATPEKPTELQFALEYDGAGGSFTIRTNGALDLSSLCKAMEKSQAWNAHAGRCAENADSTEFVIELKKA